MNYQTSNRKISNIRVEDRPRERLHLKGRESLAIEELLAILIGSGIPNKSAIELANEMLASIDGNLNQLSRFNQFDFMKFKGIGKAKASLLVAALELGRRKVDFDTSVEIDSIKSSKDAFRILQPRLGDLNHEEFWIIHMNRAAKIIKLESLSKGGVAGTAVDLKLLFKSAIEQISSSLILAHNHPSGQIQPSQADKILTNKIIEIGKLLDIQVLDHLIVTANNYFSFTDEGIML
ncbi:RadC family protein [Aquirufa sp. ROCK2-A2]